MIRINSHRIGFIGAGRAARALAFAFDTAGLPVAAVASRSFSSAEALASRLAQARPFATAQDVISAADLIFLAVPDAALPELAASLPWRPGVAVVHLSGSQTRDVLRPAEQQGATTASLHPLQTFAGREEPGFSLARVYFGIEAEGELRQLLMDIVARLGGSVIELRAADKALYHSAAVFAANYVVTLAKLATDLWLHIGQERGAALEALLPLMQGALDNLREAGLPGALTGPVARGDASTIEVHLRALAQVTPETAAVYRALALESIPVALARGGLSDAAAGALRAILERDYTVPTAGAERSSSCYA